MILFRCYRYAFTNSLQNFYNVDMFSKSSVIMILVAGILLLTAMGLNALSGAPVNSFYLLLGLLLVAFSSAMLIFKKN